jgi:hypothetical protein
METQTRIGFGGAALLTLAGLGAPLFGWGVSGPIMVGCAIVAVWGLWPVIRVRCLLDWLHRIGLAWEKKESLSPTAKIAKLNKAHDEAVMLVALPDSDFRRNRRATWMDTLRMMKQLDMPEHEIFLFQKPAGLPDQDKCLRERQQLLRSLVEKYMREQQK